MMQLKPAAAAADSSVCAHDNTVGLISIDDSVFQWDLHFLIGWWIRLILLENLCRKTLSTELTAISHKARFQLLLQLEEVQMEVDIQKYDLFGVLLGRYNANSRLLTLEVPALFCGLLSSSSSSTSFRATQVQKNFGAALDKKFW